MVFGSGRGPLRRAADIWLRLWSRELFHHIRARSPSLTGHAPPATERRQMCPQLIFPSHSPSFKASRSVSWGAGEGFSDLPYHPHMLSVLEISPIPWEPEGWGSIQCLKSPPSAKRPGLSSAAGLSSRVGAQVCSHLLSHLPTPLGSCDAWSATWQGLGGIRWLRFERQAGRKQEAGCQGRGRVDSWGGGAE